jgi:cbb3-type cytochrome oxidase maturation protein
LGCGLQRRLRSFSRDGFAPSLAGWLRYGIKFLGCGAQCLAALIPDKELTMDSLYLLIPLSVLLVLAILVGLWWAVDRGQFEDLEQEAERILRDD